MIRTRILIKSRWKCCKMMLDFLSQPLAFAFCLGLTTLTYGGEALPVGSAPPPIEAPHFPSRTHAVIWRNWELVPQERIAAAIKATPQQVAAVAASMGLPAQEKISPEVKARGYISILRRNWHLLPYDQLMILVDQSADELATRLREDDFLFIKLGSLKPDCKPVIYNEPGSAETARAAQIKELVTCEFGSALEEPGEPRFAFLREFEGDAQAPSAPDPSATTGSLRFIYSYFAPFGDPLLDANLDPYPNGLLARLQAQGVNGVWLHTVLRDMAPGGEDFPEFGKDSELRRKNLRALTERCALYGIKVYLYINEPRAMPADFFMNREQMKGVQEGEHFAMCTSHPKVRTWMSNALATVFRDAPELGGVFTITASENLTNCASKFRQQDCKHCAHRTPAEIIGEVNKTIRDGVRRSSPNARVICYDWGWNHHGDAPDVIAAQPADVDIMSVSEWALPLDRGGVKTKVGEYSLSAVGPGPRASRHWKLARDRGLGAIAKVQLNNSWEFSAVPWLPVEDLVASHSLNLRNAGVDGMMLSWSLGGYPSPNLQVAQKILDTPGITGTEALEQVAIARYGKAAAPDVLRSWSQFSKAFTEFPYNGSVLYYGPQHMGPANLLYDIPTSYSASMVGFPYDDLFRWRGPYPADVWIGQLEKVASGWEKAIESLRAALRKAEPEKHRLLKADIGLAEAAGIHFQSCVNQARFVIARGANDSGAMSDAIKNELELARRLYKLTKTDSRIGFEASNHYYYVPLDLVEKVINCQWINNPQPSASQPPR